MAGQRPQTQTFTPEAARESASPEPVRLEAEPPAPALAGRARYDGDRPLGEGGMGEVLLVRDRVVGRDVALKRVRRDVDREATRARFAREARLQGQLEHPAIVPVYDIGADEDGAMFFTMKRVRGDSLADVLERLARGESTPFSRRKLLSALSQLCLAVHYAHERGVTHRDIKPSNVMLGQYGEVYLLDWGVARAPGDAPDEAPAAGDEASPAASAISHRPIHDPIHTAPGSVLGTIETMAPEQAAGGRVGPPADVYALGAVLFHVLALEPLHPTGTFEEVSAKILKGVDARPSARGADVPPELDALCVAATRLDPADRIASALALHQAIEAYLDGDRDLELRQESSRKHAAAARSALDAAEQAEALREVGRSLAFDPSNKEALATLVDALTAPPKAPPPEVLAEEDAMRARRLRFGGIALSVVYGGLSLNALVTALLGLRDPALFHVAHVLWGLALLLALAAIRFPSFGLITGSCFTGVVAITYVSKLYSPFLIVLPIIALHATLFALVGRQTLRYGMLAAAVIGWTFSVYGHQDTFQIVDRWVHLHAVALEGPPGRLTASLYGLGLATIVVPAFVVMQMQRGWKRNEDALRMQAWKLRQLVADDATKRSPPT